MSLPEDERFQHELTRKLASLIIVGIITGLGLGAIYLVKALAP